MKKILLLSLLLFCEIYSTQAATLADPVVDLGTVTYTSSNPGACSFSVTGGADWGISATSGGCAVPTGTSYDGLVATDLKSYGQAKYAHIRIDQQSPTPTVDDPNCGKMAIANMEAKPGYGAYANFAKKGGNPSVINGYPNGIFFPFIATVEPYPNRGRCTLTQTYTVLRFAEGSSREPASSEYTPFSITFSVTLITPGAVFTHDNGAALDFGTFCQSSQTQTLTITTAGTAGSSSTLCPPANISADSFTVIMSDSSLFSVSLPSQAIDMSGGQNTVVVNNFTSSCDNGGCTPVGGIKQFFVGATITVTPAATVGEYQSSYPVSIIY